MNDEMKPCATCRHDHAWGILRYSKDNVPLYGARLCGAPKTEGSIIRCDCDNFVEAIPGQENLPAMSQSEIKELWARTSFLGAQVPLATRVAVAQIMSLGKDEHPATAMLSQWPEFIGLVISQLTDLRGAMFRDENKFAHLVAHTDEIVESMRAVVQLSERLSTIVVQNERMAEHIAELRAEVAQLRADRNVDVDYTASPETDRVFSSITAPLRDEPIATDSRPSSDSDDPADEPS